MNKYLTNKTRLFSYNTLLSKGHTKKLPHSLHVLLHLLLLTRTLTSNCWNVPKRVGVPFLNASAAQTKSCATSVISSPVELSQSPENLVKGSR